MKTKTILVPTPAAKQRPRSDDALKKNLGRAFAPLAQVIAWLQTAQPSVTIDERFPAQTGWHQIYLLKQRRLFYLTPKLGDFRFAMILGDKAIAQVRKSRLAERFLPLLRNARRYSEGTAFIFDRKSFDPPLAIALLEAKLAH